MKRLSWRSILQRVAGRRVVGIWYGLADGYLRIEMDDGSVNLAKPNNVQTDNRRPDGKGLLIEG